MKTMIRRTAGLFVSSALMFLATQASADGAVATRSYCTPDNTSKEGGFKATDEFDLGGDLNLHGGAHITSTGVLEMTSAASFGESSAAYFTEPLDLEYMVSEDKDTNRPFAVYFSFSIGPNVAEKESGAGLAFLVQNNMDGIWKTGGNGSSLGYGSIEPSMAIEFDTQQDVPPANVAAWPDPASDHVGFMLDGRHLDHPAYYLPENDFKGFTGFPSKDSKKWHVWIEYTGNDTDLVNVYLSESQTKPSAAIQWELNTSPMPKFDARFPDKFDADDWFSIDQLNLKAKGFFGMTAGTYGDSTNTHSVYEWEFSNEGIPCACQGAGACPTSLPACSEGGDTLDRGICVECTAANKLACNEKGTICDIAKEACGPCTKDADCNGHPSGERCALSGSKVGQCVECLVDAHCSAEKPVCDLEANTCIECTEDAQCPDKTPVCALQGEYKGQCIDDSDDSDTIDGGGLACTASSGSSASSNGFMAGILGALGAAAVVVRRRRRSGKQA